MSNRRDFLKHLGFKTQTPLCMSNNNSDAAVFPPSFDEMVGLLEKLFKDGLEMTKAFTTEEIEAGWVRYKTLNHLYKDEQITPNTQLPAEVEYMPILSVDTSHKDCPKQIPMAMLDEQTAQYNHGQSLQKLKSRGGLGVHEALAIIDKKHWRERNHYSMAEGIKLLNEKVSSFLLKSQSNELPAEVGLKITKAAIEYANSFPFFSNEIREAHEAGATEYANKLHDAQQLIKDWEAVDKDKKRLVREIDNIITGGMPAKQASLCDLVRPIEKLQKKHNAAVDLLEEAATQIEYLHNKFKETGSGNNVLSRIKTFLDGK